MVIRNKTINYFVASRYELNTCVDPPHNGLVTKLLFQPSTTTVTVVTVGNDGKIKTWRLQSSNGIIPAVIVCNM